MTVTEKVAIDKICPLIRFEGDTTPQMCRATDCMMWVPQQKSEEPTDGFCGLAGG